MVRSGQFRTTKTRSGSFPPRATAISLKDSFVAMQVLATRKEHRSARRASLYSSRVRLPNFASKSSGPRSCWSKMNRTPNGFSSNAMKKMVSGGLHACRIRNLVRAKTFSVSRNSATSADAILQEVPICGGGLPSAMAVDLNSIENLVSRGERRPSPWGK